VFHDRTARIDTDPQALASRLAQHYDLREFAPCNAGGGRFLHRSASAAAGDLTLTCGYTSPIQGAIGERPGCGAINICLAGQATYAVEGRALTIAPQRPLYFAPGQEYGYQTDHFSGMAFQMELARLQATAAAMAGPGVAPGRVGADLQQPRVVEDRKGCSLLPLLQRQASPLDDGNSLAAAYLPHLQLDDLLYRTLALILMPQLRQLLAEDNGGETRDKRGIIGDLVEWIDGHLEEPIALCVLERRSGYSRRSLQLAFQRHYGCGPVQWIRRRRLERARQALLNPGPEDSVGSLARRFGYRNLPAFSREFRLRFGQAPSLLLREGRRFQP
jgi:AraC-like DNA-binding protein